MCGYNEEYKAVADVCPNICPSLVEDPDKCKNEDMGSFEGCYCQEGYYRNGKTMILAWKN